MKSSAALRLVEATPVTGSLKADDDRDDSFDFANFPHYLLGVRTLWIEVIRRAAFDWVLYKNSQKMARRQLAQGAFVWLFVEDRDHPNWHERVAEDGCALSSFVGICEALEFDPEALRDGIRRLTPTKIKTLGKLPMRRAKSDATAEPGHDDLEFRMACATGAAQFIQEMRLGGEVFGDGQELDW